MKIHILNYVIQNIGIEFLNKVIVMGVTTTLLMTILGVAFSRVSEAILGLTPVINFK